ncbi:MAG: peptidoglycan DD-metalloendopeptidase family protein [Chloroflexi bacterium]|nr:peptidoglycan DD-metalloendopeptidase family protein [Chloroflexota bacterium]
MTTPLMRRRTPDQRGWSRPARPGPGRGVLLLLVLTTLLGGAFVSVPARPVSADDLSDAIARQKALATRIAKQKAQVATLTRQQKALSATLASTRNSLNQVNTDLTSVRGQIVQATVAVAAAQADVEALDTQVAKLDTELTDLEAREVVKPQELAARKALLADRIRQAYDTDRTSLLETILSGDTFTDVLAEVSYQLDFAQQDRELAEQIVADQKVLAVLHQTVEATRAQTVELRTAADDQQAQFQAQLVSLADSKARLAALEKETERLLALQRASYEQMNKDKAKLAAAIAASEKAEAELQKKIDKLVAERARGGSIPSIYNGTVEWPLAGRITQEFGCTGFAWEPPLGNCRNFHRGIDIAAPMYTPVRAAAPGVVLFAGPNPYDRSPKAWIVIIAHAENLVTWYAHVDNNPKPPVVRAGDRVVAGQVIAFVGVTGRTTGPHVDWRVEFNKTFKNPRLFL